MSFVTVPAFVAGPVPALRASNGSIADAIAQVFGAGSSAWDDDEDEFLAGPAPAVATGNGSIADAIAQVFGAGSSAWDDDDEEFVGATEQNAPEKDGDAANAVVEESGLVGTGEGQLDVLAAEVEKDEGLGGLEEKVGQLAVEKKEEDSGDEAVSMGLGAKKCCNLARNSANKETERAQRKAYIMRRFASYDYVRPVCNCNRAHIVVATMAPLLEEDEPAEEPIVVIHPLQPIPEHIAQAAAEQEAPIEPELPVEQEALPEQEVAPLVMAPIEEIVAEQELAPPAAAPRTMPKTKLERQQSIRDRTAALPPLPGRARRTVNLNATVKPRFRI